MSRPGPVLPPPAAHHPPHDSPVDPSAPGSQPQQVVAPLAHSYPPQQPYPSSIPPPPYGPSSAPPGPDPAEARQGARLVLASTSLLALGGVLLCGGCAGGVALRSQTMLIALPLVGIATILFAAVIGQIGRSMQ